MSYRILAAGIFVLGMLLILGAIAAPRASAASLEASAAHTVPTLEASRFGSHQGAFSVPGVRAAVPRVPRAWRRPWPYWGYASDYVPPYEWPVFDYPPYENFSERSRPQVYYEPGCRTDTQTVPSEAGGERTITITRCY